MNKKIFWQEPNRAYLTPLHISSSGNRLSSLAGVRWIDNYRFVANHNSGLRIALFDTRINEKPLLIANTLHRTDDISVKQISANLHEVVVSGCWDAAYSIYHLIGGSNAEIKYISTKKNADKSFSHGVSYSSDGEIFVTYSTGQNPRIQLGEKTWALPKPWGARFVSYCQSMNIYFAVCTSEVPKKNSYKSVDASIWVYNNISDSWKMKMRLPNVHSDSCGYFNDRLWISDQLGNRILGINFQHKKIMEIKGKILNFPHGISISESGILAATNFGDSSIALIDLKNLN